MLHHKIYTHPESADWVIFIHGAGGSSAIWFKQVRAFRDLFNVLLLDLRGHGKSRHRKTTPDSYSLLSVCEDIIGVMDHRMIKKAHFVGVSLGTVLMRSMMDSHPERIRSLIMVGAITYWNPWARFLILIGNALKHIVPFRVLYATFAWIIMPGRKANESRVLFRKEARNVSPAEFRKWLGLTTEIRSKLPEWRKSGGSVPILYAMGGHDYMFMPPARALALSFDNVEVTVLKNCGHVCNVEQPERFNSLATDFILESMARGG